MGYIGCATIDELHAKAQLRADLVGGPAREPRPRRDHHQGSAELPRGVTQQRCAHQLVLILDFGSQYTQLIARRIRELKRLLRDPSRSTCRSTQIRALAPARDRALGRPVVASTSRARRRSTPALFELGVPVLGICYGVQLTAQAARRRGRAGATSASTAARTCASSSGGDGAVPHGHGGRGARGVDDARRPRRAAAARASRSSARPPTRPTAAVADEKRRIYGVQFHPEVAHTPRGGELLGNFLFRVCELAPTGRWPRFVEEAVAQHPRAGRRRRAA